MHLRFVYFHFTLLSALLFRPFLVVIFVLLLFFFSGRYFIYVFISYSFIGVLIVIFCGGVYSSVNASGICLLSFHSFIGVTFSVLLL